MRSPQSLALLGRPPPICGGSDPTVCVLISSATVEAATAKTMPGFFNTTSTGAMIVFNTGAFKCFCSNPWILFFAFLLELSVLKIYCSLSIEVLALPKNKM